MKVLESFTLIVKKDGSKYDYPLDKILDKLKEQGLMFDVSEYDAENQLVEVYGNIVTNAKLVDLIKDYLHISKPFGIADEYTIKLGKEDK